MSESIDSILYDADLSFDNVWDGSVFLIPAMVEVYKMYKNSSNQVVLDGNVAIDGVYVNCTTESLHQSITEYSFMGLSVLFLIIFSFLIKRTSFKIDVFKGRPGPLLPMGMLSNHDHILEFTLAFLSVSEDIYEFIFGFKTQFGHQIPIVKFLIKLATVFMLSITSYLTFAGLQNKYLLGYLFGSIISACYSYQGIVASVNFGNCIAGTKVIPLLFSSIAYCSLDLALFFIFLYRIVSHLHRYGLKMTEKPQIPLSERGFCKHYVTVLFREKGCKETQKENIGIPLYEILKGEKLRERISEKLYREIPDFSLPPRLIIGISVGLFFAYRIFIDEIYSMTPTTWNFVNIIKDRYQTTLTNLSFAFKVISSNISQYSLGEVRNSYRHITFFYVHLLIACILASIVFGILNSIINSFLILRNYRLNFNRLTRRGFSAMIDLKKAPAPYALVLGFVRFSGYQAAYILWGTLVVIFVMTLLLYFLIGGFLLPLIYVTNSWPRKCLTNYGPVLLASIFLNFVQTAIVKNFFVKEKGELMEIDNKKAFIIYSHCAFFLNAMMGIFTSIKRMIIWSASGIICFCRIDFSSLPDYLHNSDNGYMCYIGFVYTELYHHNPILRYFTNLLLETQSTLNLDPELLSQTEGLLTGNNHLNRMTSSSQTYRNKWKVAYTLLNNKSLITERKNFLKNRVV